jgi:hypothetical protein
MKVKTTLILTATLVMQVFILSACGEVKDGKYAELAKCMTSKGVIFYGAFWCSHCANQKKTFGDDMRYVTYVECAEGGEKADPAACKKAGVQRFPSWFFPGQGMVEGEMKPEEIAVKANCPFEGAANTSETAQNTVPAPVSSEPAPPKPATESATQQ